MTHMTPKMMLWEILVPTERRDSPKRMSELLGSLKSSLGVDETSLVDKVLHPGYYSTRFHKVWDNKVRAITGGLTVMGPVRGQWVSGDNVLFNERMIPVRIMATRDQINEIADMTLEYYDQLAVMCYKISDEVILRAKDD